MNEQGIWIVYDLETNRLIQQLLTSNKFAFTFHPNLNFLKIHSQDSSKPKLEMGNEGGDIHNNIHPDAYSTESERECKQCGYRYIPKIDFGGCCSYDCQKLLSTFSAPKGCRCRINQYSPDEFICGENGRICTHCLKLNQSEINSQKEQEGRVDGKTHTTSFSLQPSDTIHSQNKGLIDIDYTEGAKIEKDNYFKKNKQEAKHE